jgi:hypothetical protein
VARVTRCDYGNSEVLGGCCVRLRCQASRAEAQTGSNKQAGAQGCDLDEDASGESPSHSLEECKGDFAPFQDHSSRKRVGQH